MRTETPRPFGWWWQKFLRGVPHPDDATFNEFEDMFFEPPRGARPQAGGDLPAPAGARRRKQEHAGTHQRAEHLHEGE